MEMARMFTVCVCDDDEVRFVIPVKNVVEPIRVTAEVSVICGEQADVELSLGGEPVVRTVRRGESAYAEAGLAAGASDDAILDAMASHPILIERPIALRGRRAVVGRPPENVLDLA